MSPICELAFEFLHCILSKVDLHTLKHCRLVQRTWKIICDEYYLPDVRISSITDLSRLVAIAQNDTIAANVRSLTFATTLEREKPENRIEHAQSTAQSLSGDHVLRRFQRLKSLTILDDQPSPTDDDMITMYRSLHLLQAAIADAGIRLVEIRAEWLHTGFFSEKATTIREAWKSLAKLHLGIMQSVDPHGLDDLKLVLPSLDKIREFNLSCHPRIRLDSIVNESTLAWNKLTDISLQGCMSTGPTLLKLLTLPNVETIVLRNILLDGGCWLRIFERLRKQNLKQVCLSGYLVDFVTDQGWGGDSDGGQALLQKTEEWITRDLEGPQYGDECPLSMENMEEF